MLLVVDPWYGVIRAQQWTTYTAADGLAHPSVRTVFQSRDGAMWFGTLGGVSRYDGIWRTFTTGDGLGHNFVNSIFQSSDGAMWFGTGDLLGTGGGGGVSRYDGGRWRTFTTADGLADNFVVSVFQSRDGAMWFGTLGGVSRYDGGRWRTFTTGDGLAGNYVFSIVQSRDGALWFGTENGVSRYDGERWQTFTTAGGLAGREVLSIFQAHDGAMWFGSGDLLGTGDGGGGVSRYDGERWQTFTTADGLTDNLVNSVFQSRDGAMWFGTGDFLGTGRGVSRYDGENWQTLTTADGLSHNVVWSIFQSRDGAMWFAMPFGVSRFDASWRTFTTADGLADNFVSSAFQSRDGAMWFATGTISSGGVNRYDGEKWETFTTENSGLAHNSVTFVFQSRDGAIWFGTGNFLIGNGGGVSRYDGEKWETFTTEDGLANDTVVSIYQDRDGVMWFGTGFLLGAGGGVSRYDGEKWETFTTEDGLGHTNVGSIFQSDDGAMWFGTRGGASRYDGERWQTFTTADGLVHNAVFAVLQSDDGAMWFGSGNPIGGGGGATRYDGENWQTFTKADGLADDPVVSVFQSDDGAMWFGTVGGASRYDGEDWQTFTTADGLAGNTVVSIFQSRDGAMWFGTDGGVSTFRRPAHALVQTMILRAPPPLLSDGRFFFECRGFEIGSDRQPPLSFALTRGAAEPQESDWSLFSVVSGFGASDLDNGEWTFYVRGQDRYGNIDPTSATSTFVVDLTAPTVAISSPRSGDVISEDAPLIGLAFDRSATPDLERFVLEYGRGEKDEVVTEWVPIGEPQSSPVENDVLGVWRIEGLQDGGYVLRISATDKLGHTSDHTVSVTLVSALEDLEKDVGGRVVSPKGRVELMVPPNGLVRDTRVQITFRPRETLSALPEVGVLGIAYEIGPGDLRFNKRSTLTIGYDPVDVVGMNEADLAIFILSGGSWTRLGGTVDETVNKISVGIQEAGTYALFEAASVEGATGVSEVVCQPRIISPSGGLYPGTTDISFKLGRSASVDVRIYGVSGNLIREVVGDRRLNAGLNMVQWDGRDRNGQVVKDGIYVVVVRTEGQAANKTVAVLNR